MAIEIVDLPIKNGWIFHSFFVGLPAGIPFGYFTVRHGKSSLSIGTSSVSMGHFPITQPRGLLIYSHHLFTHISYQIFPLPPIMYIYNILYYPFINPWLASNNRSFTSSPLTDRPTALPNGACAGWVRGLAAQSARRRKSCARRSSAKP